MSFLAPIAITGPPAGALPAWDLTSAADLHLLEDVASLGNPLTLMGGICTAEEMQARLEAATKGNSGLIPKATPFTYLRMQIKELLDQIVLAQGAQFSYNTEDGTRVPAPAAAPPMEMVALYTAFPQPAAAAIRGEALVLRVHGLVRAPHGVPLLLVSFAPPTLPGPVRAELLLRKPNTDAVDVRPLGVRGAAALLHLLQASAAARDWSIAHGSRLPSRTPAGEPVQHALLPLLYPCHFYPPHALTGGVPSGTESEARETAAMAQLCTLDPPLHQRVCQLRGIRRLVEGEGLPPSQRETLAHLMRIGYGRYKGLLLKQLGEEDRSALLVEHVRALCRGEGVWDEGASVPAEWAAELAGAATPSRLQVKPGRSDMAPNELSHVHLQASSDGSSVQCVCAPAPALDVRVCHFRECGATLPPESTLVCSGCKRVYYCGPACQRQDWKGGGHKLACKRERE